MKQYKQTKEVSWLMTPAGTIWAGIEVDYYIQPVEKSLQDTVMGVNLYLLNNKDREIFARIRKMDKKREKILEDIKQIVNKVIALGPENPLWKTVEDFYIKYSDGLFSPDWTSIEDDDVDQAMYTDQLEKLYYELVKLLPINGTTGTD